MAKKIRKNADANNLLDFIRTDKIQNENDNKLLSKERATLRSINKNKPSQNGIFIQWKNRSTDKWSAFDFIGYYLHCYLETIGEEDIDFKGKNANYKYGKERNYINRHLDSFFDEDKESLMKYIGWVIKWWISDDSFVTGYPSFWSVFTEKATFVKIFKENQASTRVIKKKLVKKTRKENDNKMASSDAWDEYFDKE